MHRPPAPKTRIPRPPADPSIYRHPPPSQSSGWILWCAIGLMVAIAAFVIVNRLGVQKAETESIQQVGAWLENADKLVAENRDAEAEELINKAIALRPQDPRSKAAMDRLTTKRDLIRKKQETSASMALEQAKMMALSDVEGAIVMYEAIIKDANLPAESRKTATEKLRELKAGACVLTLPEDWPPDAVVSVDGREIPRKGNQIPGIEAGFRKVVLSRYGHRTSPPFEIQFKGTEPIPLPKFAWTRPGTQVSITSNPPGASVWIGDRETGKVTPCVIEDVDDGPVEYRLTLAGRATTTVRGEVKGRQPIRLSVDLPEP